MQSFIYCRFFFSCNRKSLLRYLKYSFIANCCLCVVVEISFSLEISRHLTVNYSTTHFPELTVIESFSIQRADASWMRNEAFFRGPLNSLSSKSFSPENCKELRRLFVSPRCQEVSFLEKILQKFRSFILASQDLFWI